MLVGFAAHDAWPPVLENNSFSITVVESASELTTAYLLL